MEQLYENKILNEFLKHFLKIQWNELCILCMEYGALMLNKNYEISKITIEHIKSLINNLIDEKDQKNFEKEKNNYQNLNNNNNININNINNNNCNDSLTNPKQIIKTNNIEEKSNDDEKNKDNESNKLFKPIHNFRRFDYIVLENRPCRILYYHLQTGAKSSPHDSYIIKAIDIFTGKLYEDRINKKESAEYPLIKKNTYTVQYIDNFENLTLMEKNGTIIKDIQLPSETEQDYILSKEIKEKFNEGKEISVKVIESMGIKKIINIINK